MRSYSVSQNVLLTSIVRLNKNEKGEYSKVKGEKQDAELYYLWASRGKQR